MPSSSIRVLANAAFSKVSAAQGESWAEDYGRQAKQLPALIHQCGLCQALTFLQAKGAGESGLAKRKLLEDLAAALEFESVDLLLEQARQLDTPSYHLLGRTVLRCAEWFKRYAEALLRIDEPADEGESE